MKRNYTKPTLHVWQLHHRTALMDMPTSDGTSDDNFAREDRGWWDGDDSSDEGSPW